jgi:hypothetical protein
MVMDEKGSINDENVYRAFSSTDPSPSNRKRKAVGSSMEHGRVMGGELGDDVSSIFKLAKMLVEKALDPVGCVGEG